MTTMESPTQIRFGASAGDRTGVHRARRSELPDTAANLAHAFADDPVFAYCFPDADRRATAVPAFFDVVVQTLWVYDEIYTMQGVGGAVWVPPGEPAVPVLAEKAFDHKIADIAGLDIERFGTLNGLQERNHPTEECAYLWFVGVDPSAQGRGNGSALMAPTLRRCDAEGVPAYLEATNERSRDGYRRLGFEVVSRLEIPGGPTMWPMWREPERAAS